MNRLGLVLFVLLLAAGIVNAGRAAYAAGAGDDDDGNAAAGAPSITTQPASQTVTVGQRATFTVAAAGTAPLSYQWKKDGRAISGATSSSYTTLPATMSEDDDDGWRFTVVVSNTAGSVTSNAAALKVNAAAVAPTIRREPASQTVTAGQTATFTVAAKGTHPLSYQWMKGTTTLAGATSSSYTTPPAASGDDGSQFTVVVSNTAGSVTSNAATLTVNAAAVAPTITTQPANQTVTAGQTATFTVVATGTALKYQWMKGTTTLAGATSSSYTTPPTTSTDNGAQFSVMVSNTAGSVTSNAATLMVNAAAVAPTITTQPANQTVTAGQTATFTVAATGTAPLKYQWMKGTTTLAGANSSSYTTPVTTSADGGAQFTVVVSNTAGSVTSNAATLTVSAAAVAPTITTQPANQTVTAGQTATFTVVATGTALKYQWMRGTTTLAGANSSSYTTPPTTSGDNGVQFSVVVSNTAGSVTSNAATLTVSAAAVAPTITTQPANQTVTAGQTATFTVVASGTPPLTYRWMKGNTTILGATSSSYTTPATTSTDNGAQFSVVVSNIAGSATSNAATLTVNSTTGTMPQFGHVFIVMGENTSFSEAYNSSNMPYLTSLANQYGVSLHYWADTHPSIGNDLNMASGVIPTNNDSDSPSSLPLSIDNIAFEVQQAGKTWKDYVESDPKISGCGGINSGTYYVRHDPLQYFTDINTETANFVCFSQFAKDLANHTLPNFSWLSPNGTDDGHDTSASTFDSWLKTVITPLLASSYFQPGGDGLLIITWDEDDKGGTPNCTTTTVGLGCGGQVETVVISPLSKLGYQSTAGDPANFNSTYDEANILRTLADALGLNASKLGAAAVRVPMADFFN